MLKPGNIINQGNQPRLYWNSSDHSIHIYLTWSSLYLTENMLQFTEWTHFEKRMTLKGFGLCIS